MNRPSLIALAASCLVLAASHAAEAPAARKPAMLGPRAGEPRTVAGLALCWCPPGKFLMGSPLDEPGRRTDETQVEVTLTQGFWLGKFEVTQREWKRFRPLAREADVAGRGDDFPVYWVSYLDAQEFCRWLTREARAAGELSADWEFNLPTEAQWEYACRAGTTTAFAFGATLTTRDANIGRPFRGEPAGFPRGSAEPVGRYPANAWGLHDMHGNEFEWCRDWFHRPITGGIDPDLSDRQGTPNRDGTVSRVRRGGAWMDGPEFCRSAVRLPFEPERSSNHIGFRVALVPARATSP
ncbi:MAG: formylglycine-generating enzyme family protein [Verrucomicrobia bacterium]|nr:formylglycine-generating enzyme family protein [Verrucomicrobiota bacterium]